MIWRAPAALAARLIAAILALPTCLGGAPRQEEQLLGRRNRMQPGGVAAAHSRGEERRTVLPCERTGAASGYCDDREPWPFRMHPEARHHLETFTVGNGEPAIERLVRRVVRESSPDDVRRELHVLGDPRRSARGARCGRAEGVGRRNITVTADGAIRPETEGGVREGDEVVHCFTDPALRAKQLQQLDDRLRQEEAVAVRRGADRVTNGRKVLVGQATEDEGEWMRTLVHVRGRKGSSAATNAPGAST